MRKVNKVDYVLNCYKPFEKNPNIILKQRLSYSLNSFESISNKLKTNKSATNSTIEKIF